MAGLEGITATVGKGSWINNQWEHISHAILQIPLLPPLYQIPPPQFDTEQLVYEQIISAAPLLLESLRPDSNYIGLSHGSFWGFLPEITIANLLTSQGYAVDSTFPRIGGRKRIQEHAILF